MADKTIRYSIDDKGVSQSNEKIRRSFEETQRKILDTQKEGKRLSRDEIQDLEKKIKLQEQLNRQKEEQLKREIEDRNISVQKQKIELDNWKRQRTEQASGLTGSERESFMRETVSRTNVRQESISNQKADILNRRKEYTETRDSNRKQISELRNVTDTIKNESSKGRRSTGNLMNRIVGGGSTAAGGGLGGAISGAGMMLGGPMALIGAAALITNMTKGYQQSLQQFSTATQLPSAVSNMIAGSFRNATLGLSATGGLEKSALFTGALKNRMVGGNELFGLVGAQISRGVSDQQISQLLSLQRYSGTSALGTIGTAESYFGGTPSGNRKITELLDSYLRTANQILQRTGRVDAISLQQTMMSIGKSYGVEGVNLDRMTGNIVGAASNTNNSILKSMQLQTLRRMYPGKSMWEMRKIMEDPTSDPEYIKNLMNTITSSFGGGDYAKFAMLGMGLGPTGDIEKMMAGDFNLTGRPSSSGGKHIQDKYINEAGNFVGSVDKIETAIGTLKDALLKNSSNFYQLLAGLFNLGGDFYKSQTESIYKGTRDAIIDSGGRFP